MSDSYRLSGQEGKQKPPNATMIYARVYHPTYVIGNGVGSLHHRREPIKVN
jgi:hypothetical protein